MGSQERVGREGGKEQSRGGSKNEPVGGPETSGSRSFVEAGADARQERSGDLGVGGEAQAGINGGEEGLLEGKGGAALGAGSEMRAEFRGGFGAGSGGLD